MVPIKNKLLIVYVLNRLQVERSMEPGGLKTGIGSLAGQLLEVSIECYNILADIKDLDIAGSFQRQLNTERHRFMGWMQAWGIKDDAVSWDLDPNDYRSRYAVATFARIVSLLSSADILASKYGIRALGQADEQSKMSRLFRRGNKLPGPSTLSDFASHGFSLLSLGSRKLRSSGRLQLSIQNLNDAFKNLTVFESKYLLPGLNLEVLRLQEIVNIFLQIILPLYKKFRLAVVDKSSSSRLIEELRRYNDSLFNALPPSSLATGCVISSEGEDGQIQEAVIIGKGLSSPGFSKFTIPPPQLQVRMEHKKIGIGKALMVKVHGILKPPILDIKNETPPNRHIAVLQGPSLGGEDEICFEYARRYSSSYSSVFFFSAYSHETLKSDLATMVNRISKHYQTSWGDSTPDYQRIGVALNLPGLIGEDGKIDLTTCSSKMMAGAAQKWLSSVGNDNWLVMVCHYDIDSAHRVTFQHIIPKGDFGNILITCRRPEAMNPAVGKVYKVEKVDAISIWLATSGETQIDLDNASSVIRKLITLGSYHQNIVSDELDNEYKVTLTMGYDMGVCLLKAGDYNGSLGVFRQVLSGREKLLGKDYHQTLNTSFRIACSLSGLKRHEEAIRIYRQVLKDSERVLGGDHVQTLLTKHGLAYELAEIDKYDEAVELGRQTLKGMKKVWGEEHRRTMFAAHNLASDLCDLHRYEESLEIYRQLLPLREKVLGKEHRDTLATANNLAADLMYLRKYEEAIEVFQEVLKGRERLLGQEHDLTMCTIRFLKFSKAKLRKTAPDPN